MKKFLILLLVFTCAGVWAQDFGFGFGDDSEAVSSSASSAKVKVSGDITVELSPFVHDFGKEEGAQEISFWDMVSGTLNFSASGSNIEAFASFNLNADAIRELGDANPMLDDPTYTPLIMNEAYLKAYIGAVNIEAGLRKLTWGKADSPGPLDVTNPMDYTDLRYITDTLACKIARPMIHVTWNAGAFSKLEGVFIPNFAGHRFAMDGRWRPSQYDSIRSNAEAGISSIADEKLKLMASDPAFIPIYMANHNIMNEVLIGVGGGLAYLGEDPSFPSTGAFENFQAGLHYTTTIGSADIGAQYFYGNLFRPNFTIAGIDAYLEDLAKNILSGADPIKYDNTSMISPQLKYTRYHQIGVDYAQVLFGFNVRAEAAFNLTEDFSGDDGSVQNPFIGWSLGFDRDLFLGVNLNLQC
ncbi:MAG: hypothetical protein LBI04_03420, partial [Treponema sp.]|nr:hypothetical protein [Treponema sp.]